MSKGIRAVAILVVILGAAAAIVLGVFQIRSIDVRGNERYSAGQIRDDLIHDFKTRNTLYFSWKYRSKDHAADAPYLKNVQAVMLSPTSVRIVVEESQMVGRVQYEDKNVYYDADGVVQEITDTIYTGIPLVTGVEIEAPQLYQKLVTKNASLLRTMLNITQLLIKSELNPDSVSFDANQNMILRFGPVTVQLGQDEYLEEKIANLVSIYPQIEGEAGTLNMEGFTGKNEAITFKADSAPEPESETESGEEEGAAKPESGDSLAGGAGGEENPSGEEEGTQEDVPEEPEITSTTFMVFDSSGTLRYDAHVEGGQVVDSYGNPIDGCYVNENGNVVDAYWNEIDPATGQLAQ